MIEQLNKQIENDNFQKNEKEFIGDFIAFMKSKDVYHYEFEGLNPYNGYIAVIRNNDESSASHRVGIEYNKRFVKVFTINHVGEAKNQCVSLHGDEAKPILDILFERFKEWGGF